MSRINDALKQARQSQRNQPPAGVPPLTPAAATTLGGIGWILPATVVLLLVAAGIFLGLAFFKHTATPVVTPAARVAEIAVPQPAPVEPAPVAVVTVQTNAVPVINSVAVIAPPVTAPQPRLQGIVADPRRPWAIVSGNTVFVGDAVADFRVTAISQKTVTLKMTDGSVKTLTLPE